MNRIVLNETKIIEETKENVNRKLTLIHKNRILGV